MTPEETVDHRIMLFTATTVAHMARCMDKAGILDDEAKQSISRHLADLSETSTALGHPAQLAWLDLLVRLFPPLPNGRS